MCDAPKNITESRTATEDVSIEKMRQEKMGYTRSMTTNSRNTICMPLGKFVHSSRCYVIQ